MGFSLGIPSLAARGLLGSEAKSTMDFGKQTIAQQKNTLRTWFARYFDEGMTKDDVENWFDTLGACTGKGEISENKEKLTTYLMQTKGFSTGEDFVLSLNEDIEEANEDMQCGLSVAAIRTIHRYMVSKSEEDQAVAPTAASAATGINGDGQSMAVGSAATTVVSTMMADNAAKALLKIAGSGSNQVLISALIKTAPWGLNTAHMGVAGHDAVSCTCG